MKMKDRKAIIEPTKTVEVSETPTNTDFDGFLKKMSDPRLLSVPKDLVVIPNTYNRFYRGGLHCVHGLSKTGKTYMVLDSIYKNTTMKKIWLDGDLNDKTMVDRFSTITHLAPLNPDSYFDMWINSNIDFSDVLFIVDSLKDFREGKEMDSNTGMDDIIKRLKKLTKMGATVIVILHSTAYGADKDKIKLKGNAEAVYSNTDVTYRYERDFDTKESILYCERSRIEGLESGTQTQIYKTKSKGMSVAVKQAKYAGLKD